MIKPAFLGILCSTLMALGAQELPPWLSQDVSWPLAADSRLCAVEGEGRTLYLGIAEESEVGAGEKGLLYRCDLLTGEFRKLLELPSIESRGLGILPSEDGSIRCLSADVFGRIMARESVDGGKTWKEAAIADQGGKAFIAAELRGFYSVSGKVLAFWTMLGTGSEARPESLNLWAAERPIEGGEWTVKPLAVPLGEDRRLEISLIDGRIVCRVDGRVEVDASPVQLSWTETRMYSVDPILLEATLDPEADPRDYLVTKGETSSSPLLKKALDRLQGRGASLSGLVLVKGRWLVGAGYGGIAFSDLALQLLDIRDGSRREIWVDSRKEPRGFPGDEAPMVLPSRGGLALAWVDDSWNLHCREYRLEKSENAPAERPEPPPDAQADSEALIRRTHPWIPESSDIEAWAPDDFIVTDRWTGEFLTDPDLPGAWSFVALVDSFEDFDPGNPPGEGEGLPQETNLVFGEGGRILPPGYLEALELSVPEDGPSWSRGSIRHFFGQRGTVSAYRLAGDKDRYLLIEIKTDEYRRGAKPMVGVFRRTEN